MKNPRQSFEIAIHQLNLKHENQFQITNYSFLKLFTRFKPGCFCGVYFLPKTDMDIADNIQRISYHYKKPDLAANVENYDY